MFIRSLDEIKGTDRYKKMPRSATISARYLTKTEGMGFSLHVNRGEPISPVQLWYRNHWEANYLISGALKITDLASGEEWVLGPGDLYQVGPNDRHLYEVLETEHHLSIFCPALHGTESHDSDGAYPPSGPLPETSRTMFVRRISEMRLAGAEMVVANGNARTIRAITKADGIGFSLSDVKFAAGARATLWYKHHWETNYIISGTGTVDDLSTGESWTLEPDMAYNVGPKDRHLISANSDIHLVSVFCPPLAGTEQHDADGALNASGPVPCGPVGY